MHHLLSFLVFDKRANDVILSLLIRAFFIFLWFQQVESQKGEKL